MPNVYVDNTNVITLLRLRSTVGNTVIDSADVTVTITTLDGEDFAGPIDMELTEESPSQGNYRGILPAEIEFEPDTEYVAIIEVGDGPERIGHWEIPILAKTRQ